MSEDEKTESELEAFYVKDAKEVQKDDGIKRRAIMNTLAEKHGNAMSAHSEEYTKLLEEYIENSKKTSQQKKLFKNVFFWVAITTLCLSFLLFTGMCVYFSLQDFSKTSIEDLSGLISSLVGVLSLYIIIPRIIAEYLFNVKEDKHMAKIVKSVQKYDAKVFSDINASEELLLNKDKKEEANKAVMADLKKNVEEKIKSEEEAKNQNDVLPDTPKDEETSE